MGLPKVSVIIPTFGRQTLLKAVNSVLSQSLRELELIVVVDPYRPYGSNLPKLVKDPRVRIFHLDLDKCSSYLPSRVALLRNYGIQSSRGQYIAHLDDDNWWSPVHLEKLCQLLDSQREYGFAHSWRIIVNENDNPVPLYNYPWSTRYNNHDVIFSLFLEYGLIDLGKPYIRDSVLSKSGDEIFHIDTSELCIRKEIHHRVPFRVNYTLREIIEGQGDDKVLCESMYRQGIKQVCSQEYSLYYRLGGFSNSDIGTLWKK